MERKMGWWRRGGGGGVGSRGGGERVGQHMRPVLLLLRNAPPHGSALRARTATTAHPCSTITVYLQHIKNMQIQPMDGKEVEWGSGGADTIPGR
jgi:hypothetical protein